MLNEFIDKILVHERDRKGHRSTMQEIETYFNFVSKFVPPAFGEVELTPQELEELRKREERKERLHQTYLKQYRPMLYNELILSSKIHTVLADLNEQASNRLHLIIRQIAEAEGVIEAMKAANQMKLIKQMNACQAQAEEIVKHELIYIP